MQKIIVICSLLTLFVQKSNSQLDWASCTNERTASGVTACTDNVPFATACAGTAEVADQAACQAIATATAANFDAMQLGADFPPGCYTWGISQDTIYWNPNGAANCGTASANSNTGCICEAPGGGGGVANCNTGPHACTPAGLTLIASPGDTDCSGADASSCDDATCCTAVKCSTHTCTVAGNVLIAAAATTNCDEAGCADAECCVSACAEQTGCDLQKCQLQNGLGDTACA